MLHKDLDHNGVTPVPIRGGVDEEPDEADAAFGAAHGIAEAVPEEDDNADIVEAIGNWPDDRLDQPLHPYTDVTVREYVYGFMRIKVKGNVHDEASGDFAKLFERAMPKDDHNAPGCAPQIHFTPRHRFRHTCWPVFMHCEQTADHVRARQPPAV